MSKYKKYTQLEHVLARPDTYIGSTAPETIKDWCYCNTSNRMVYKDVEYIPGLYKIFDEVVVNAIDQSTLDTSVDSISIDVDVESGFISVFNSGGNIPIELHSEEKIMIPELIFGNLLTSENYDDNVKRTTGGRNGYGAKLANIFSEEFNVEIYNKTFEKKYKQTWKNNMSICEKPTITKCTNKIGYVKITFKPDLSRFGIDKMKDDMFIKRAYDCCANTGENVKVSYNGKVLPYKSFDKYVDLYLGKETPRVHMMNGRWDVVVSFSNDGYKQVSFVNGINTMLGGSHVEQVVKNLITKMQEQTKKTIELRPSFIKEHLFIFVKSILENPTFSSQTKHECTSKWSTFGSRLEISDGDIKKISKLGILQEAQALARHKEQRELEKTGGTKKNSLHGIVKLDDANKAGTSGSDKCTLILTEGDSAKTFAISGLSIVGRDYYGVFPLRGKMLNTRDATAKQIQGNEEICNLTKILGLQYGKKYSTTKELRYGKIMILTDADVDGYHIKGLIMNFVHSYWPGLVRNDFICSMNTPIVKISKGSEKLAFYHMKEFDEWKEKKLSGWKVKYYKGLGTSTANEAKDYFKTMGKNMTNYKWDKPTDDNMLLAFKKEKTDERKLWIKNSLETKEIITNPKSVGYSDFINKEFVWFSIADNVRSIPSMVDGLKPSQRKVVYACRKRSNNEIKVSQLAGYVSTETSYHHGEASLMSTIVGLAQNFVGTGNYNLLEPIGQFGTRLMGGKDHASARYIFTRLSSNSNIFHKHDDPLLTYLNDDGTLIEPEYYVPLLPLVLINGATGIGTGYSTDIPCYNPDDIKNNIKRHLEGKPYNEMKPYYRGFKGTIEKKDEYTWETKGNIKLGTNGVIEVNELPVGKWTQDYKEFLEGQIGKMIEDYENHSSDIDVLFRVKGYKGKNIFKDLRLTTSIKTSNMYLFDEEGVIKKYENVLEILKDFIKVRLEYYGKRKEYLLKQWTLLIEKYDEMYRFICDVINEKIVVFRRKKHDIIKDMKLFGYKKIDDLLDIKLTQFTEEKLNELKGKIEQLRVDHRVLNEKSINDLYKEDL